MERPSSPLPAGRWGTVRAAMLIVGILALSALPLLIPASFIAGLGGYGYLGVFALVCLASATVLVPSPASLAIVFTAAKVLDPWLVGIAAGLGATLGEVSGYIAGRSGSGLMQGSRHYARIASWVTRYGALTIFVLALIPNPLLDFAGLAAGTMKMPFRRYLAACLLGKTLRFVIVAWAARLV